MVFGLSSSDINGSDVLDLLHIYLASLVAQSRLTSSIVAQYGSGRDGLDTWWTCLRVLCARPSG